MKHNDDSLVVIKAFLRANNELLALKITQRTAKIALLCDIAYPEFRLFKTM
jgi:hypothetical protein